MEFQTVLDRLEALADEEVLASKDRVGIPTDETLGISKPDLRDLAGEIGTDHELAGELWETGIHEARVVASIVADPAQLTEAQADAWVADVDSWALCDQCCTDLFRHTDFARAKAHEWLRRDPEFEKRAGFVMIAVLARHREQLGDEVFVEFLDRIEAAADDGRHYVKKGASWAIREIGKRNNALREAALETARRLEERDTTVTRWIARDVGRDIAPDE